MTSYIASVPGIDSQVVKYGKLALIAAFLWLTVIRFLIERKRLEAQFGNFEKIIFLFIVWVGIISVNAVRPSASISTLLHIVLLLIVYYAAVETISRRSHVWTAFYLVLLASIITALYSASLLLGGPIFRIVGFLGNANSLGILGFTTLAILIVAATMSRNLWEKSLFIVGIISSLFFLAFSWSRASWLGAFGFAVVYLWLERRRTFKLLTILAIILVVIVLAYEPFYSTFYKLGRVGSATTRREVYWQHGIMKALERPVFGHGFNLLKGDIRGPDRLVDIQEVTVFKESDEQFYTHNLLVLLFLSTGLPGLIMFSLAYYYLFKRHRLWRETALCHSRRALALGDYRTARGECIEFDVRDGSATRRRGIRQLLVGLSRSCCGRRTERHSVIKIRASQCCNTRSQIRIYRLKLAFPFSAGRGILKHDPALQKIVSYLVSGCEIPVLAGIEPVLNQILNLRNRYPRHPFPSPRVRRQNPSLLREPLRHRKPICFFS